VGRSGGAVAAFDVLALDRGGAHLPARLTAATATPERAWPDADICRSIPAGPGGPDRRVPEHLRLRRRQAEDAKAGRPRVPVPQDRRQAIRFTANAGSGADQREAAPAQDRGRASALVTPAAWRARAGVSAARSTSRPSTPGTYRDATAGSAAPERQRTSPRPPAQSPSCSANCKWPDRPRPLWCATSGSTRRTPEARYRRVAYDTVTEDGYARSLCRS